MLGDAIRTQNTNTNSIYHQKKRPSTPTPSSERTPLPQLLPEFPEQKRRWQPQPHSDKPQQTIPPPVIQRRVHIRREQRKAEAGQTPQHRRGPDRRGGESGVRIDEIGLNALKAHDDARPEDGGADIGYDPMSVVLGRPAIQEETDGHEQAAREHERDTELGLADAVVALLQLPVYPIVDRGADLGAEEESRSERYIVEAADADRFVVPCLP